MRKYFLILIVGMAALSFSNSSNSFASGSHYVKAHTTKKGRYVKGHRSTNPNHSKSDNWSTKGNVNPYTGRPGTKKP